MSQGAANDQPTLRAKDATLNFMLASLDGRPSSTACPSCGQLLQLVVDLRLTDAGRRAEHIEEEAEQ